MGTEKATLDEELFRSPFSMVSFVSRSSPLTINRSQCFSRDPWSMENGKTYGKQKTVNGKRLLAEKHVVKATTVIAKSALEQIADYQ